MFFFSWEQHKVRRATVQRYDKSNQPKWLNIINTQNSDSITALPYLLKSHCQVWSWRERGNLNFMNFWCSLFLSGIDLWIEHEFLMLIFSYPVRYWIHFSPSTRWCDEIFQKCHPDSPFSCEMFWREFKLPSLPGLSQLLARCEYLYYVSIHHDHNHHHHRRPSMCCGSDKMWASIVRVIEKSSFFTSRHRGRTRDGKGEYMHAAEKKESKWKWWARRIDRKYRRKTTTMSKCAALDEEWDGRDEVWTENLFMDENVDWILKHF